MMQGQPTASDAPTWLVDFLVSPPAWFLVVLVLAAGACLVVVARKVASDDFYISHAEQRQMLLIVGTAEGVALGVMAGMGAGLSYFPAVAVGLVGGFALVEVIRRFDPILDVLTLDETTRIALAWAGIGGSAVGAPIFVESGQAGRALSLGVGGIAAALFLWAVLQEQGDGETIGETIREGASDD